MKIFIILLSTFISFNLLAEEAAKVLSSKGEVLVGDRKVKAGDVIEVGETIETLARSFVKLQFIDESQTTMGPSSKMIVETFSQKKPGILNLIKGSIKSKVTKDYMNIDKNSSKLFIKSNSASMGVRGTEFIWTYEPGEDQTGLITLEGVVRFVSLRTAEEKSSHDPAFLDSMLNSKRAVTVRKGEASYHNKHGVEVNKTELLPSNELQDVLKINFETVMSSKHLNKAFANKKIDKSKKNMAAKDDIDLFGDQTSEEEVADGDGVKKDGKNKDKKRDFAAQKKKKELNSGKSENAGDAAASVPESFAFPLAEELVSDKPVPEKEFRVKDSKSALNGEVDENTEINDELRAKLAEKDKLDQEELTRIGERAQEKTDKAAAVKKILANKIKEKEGSLARSDQSFQKKSLGTNQLIRKENPISSSLIKKYGTTTFKADLNGEVDPDKFQADSKELIDKNLATIKNALSTSTLTKSLSTITPTTSTTSQTTAIVKKVVNTIVSTSSEPARDPASDEGAAGVSQEDADAAQALYDKCITDYKVKHKLAVDAPVSAYMTRQQEAVAYCTEQQAAASTGK